MQLALDPIRTGRWCFDETRNALERAGIEVVSGMMAPAGEDYGSLESIRATGGVRPGSTWEENRRAAKENAALADGLGLRLVTMHAGCVPEDEADPLRAVMLGRLREVCAAFADRGVRVAFETGQDSPATMIGVVEELAEFQAGVNYDPANLILYGSADPIEALETLAPWIVQAHIKDAIAAIEPGRWGEEVPVGRGEVDWARFFTIVRERLPGIDLVIEREAGGRRILDVAEGARLVQRLR